MKKCRYCGRENESDAVFCTGCGLQDFEGDPPPIPKAVAAKGKARSNKILVAPLTILALFAFVVFSFRYVGLIRRFRMPSAAMSPALFPDDQGLAEGFSYIFHGPHRPDIIIFKTDGLSPTLQPGSLYIKRVMGEPGDRLRLADGKLYVNDKALTLSNAAGEIVYVNLKSSRFLASSNETITVPEKSYFVLGDNSSNSLDSRFWGFLPEKNVKGKIWFRYLPLDRIGKVK